MATDMKIWRAPLILGAILAVALGWAFDSAVVAAVAFPFASVAALVVLALGEAVFTPSQETESEAQGNAATSPAPRGRRADALAASYAPGMFDVPELMRAERWDEARMAMQKIAYTIKSEPTEKQEEFRQLMTEFAALDPLLKTGVAAILPAVAARPGRRQTELYALLAPLTQEEARYVLYFAAELGAVRRVKKGNSYLVYPGDFVLPGDTAN